MSLGVTRCNEEGPKTSGRRPSQGIFALAIYFSTLKGLENLLEEGGQINNRRHAVITLGVLSPPPSSTTRSRGEEALGGFSLKEGAWPSEAECD